MSCTDDCNRPNRPNHPRLKFGTVKYYVVLFLPYFNLVKSITTFGPSSRIRESYEATKILKFRIGGVPVLKSTRVSYGNGILASFDSNDKGHPTDHFGKLSVRKAFNPL